ncbi:hypothetical protein RB195_018025 [Necator americanus]|uniref:Peptidase M13 N-terminal domain-containing protein n=1 Tax=Necator americanus TaxID=51031 RepID=A0ABR1C9V0_NECAM
MWKLLMKTSFCCCCALLIRSQVEAESNNVGSSEGYKIASHMLINSMNFSVDPCIDFFEFTCGNWKANHPIPNHKTRYSQFEVVADKVQGEMRGIFESEEVFGSISMNTLKAMYRRCMDKDKLNAIGARRLIESIRNHSVWPMLDGDQKWSLEDFNLTSLLVHVAQVRGVHVFVRSYVTIDSRNVSQRIMKGIIELTETRRRYIYTVYETGEELFLGTCDSSGVSGVGILVNTSMAKNFDAFEHLTTRIVHLRIRRCGPTPALDIFVAYAPTSSYEEEEEVEAFYMDLKKFYREDHAFYRVIIGDFNAKIDPRRSEPWSTTE